MKLLAAGRASQIYDLGDGRVLRRFVGVGFPEREAAVMEHARAHGFPVPRVLEQQHDGLLLEKVEGRTMAQDLWRRPWRAGAHARSLADLHAQLHAIPALDSLSALDEGDAVLHLDLHPLNVILSRAGPVVIDWTNARRGTPEVDVALTWLITMTSAPAPARVFGRAFARAVGRDAIARGLRTAADFRLRDPNVSDVERRRVLARLERGSLAQPSRPIQR